MLRVVVRFEMRGMVVLSHMAEKHGIKNKSATQVRITAERIYKKYAPFQFLAYWFEVSSFN